MPVYQWAEQNIEIPPSESEMSGPYRIENSPEMRFVYEAIISDTIKNVTIMASAQVGKTLTLMVSLCHSIVESPCPTMWVTADADMAGEFCKARLVPFMEQQKCLKEFLPKTRSDDTKKFIQFATMQLFFRGPNSPGKLASTPIERLYGDEVDKWKPGAYDRVKKRITSFMKGRTLLISTPEEIGSSVIWREYLKGTQTHFHWPCPFCGHFQPFRFGKKPDAIFEKERTLGGFVWDENEVTRPNGKWNWAELRKTVRYQCEHCGEKFGQERQFAILQQIKPVDMNANPEPKAVSFYKWQAYSLNVKWDDIACEFLHSVERMKVFGDIEPMKKFVTETLGQPWELRQDENPSDALEARKSKYKQGEKFQGEEKSWLVLTADVQREYIRFVIREWRKGGSSRLIHEGRTENFAALSKIQKDHAITGNRVWVDSGDRTAEVYTECFRYNWMATAGSNVEGWQAKRKVWIGGEQKEKYVEMPYRFKVIDPIEGAKKENPNGVKFFTWSNKVYKSRLYLMRLQGKGPIWEIPIDVSEEYIREMTDERLMRAKNGEQKWVDSGCNHAGDCELLQLLAADVLGFTSSDNEPENKQ